MRIETHQEAFDVHKKAIFTWALEIEGIERAQRIVGLHASRGIIKLLGILLHKKQLIDEGFQVNHRWFKSPKVLQKFPAFPDKETILTKLMALELLCENLSYGTAKPVENAQCFPPGL